MAESLILLIVVTQVVFYAAVAYIIWYFRRKLAERESLSADLAQSFSPRSAGLEHRIDVAAIEASTALAICEVCCFANSKQVRFCVLCGYKIKQTPSERVREREGFTARQELVRRRREWRRCRGSEGKLMWSYSSVGAPITGTPPASYVVRLSSSLDRPGNELSQHPSGSDSPFDPLRAQGARVAMMPTVSTDAREFALPLVNAVVVPYSTITIDEDELVELSEKAFPVKFAYFVARSSSLLRPAETEVLELVVRREFVVEKSLEFLCCLKPTQLHSVMRINFAKESGIDAGGVHREWFVLLNELVVDPSLGLFTLTASTDQAYTLNPGAVDDERLVQLFAVGRLLGRALLEGEILNFHLSLPLLKIILGHPLTWDDLVFLDPVLHKNLQWMLVNSGAESLGLDFTAVVSPSSAQTIELVPGGTDVAVTDANKHQYVQRLAQYMLVERISTPLYAFLQGLYEVIPRQTLMLFDAHEFDYVLCGSDTIDVEDWERHTKSSKNLRKSRVLRWFWQIVRDMPHEYRRRLLQFATGCSRVPLVGFRGLTSYDGRICPFTLKGVAYEAASPYIRSHACFNRLDLPLYPTRSELREVLYAVLDTDAYGFTTA